VAGRGLRDRLGQRVAAGAADPGHSPVVHQDGGAGPQYGLVPGGGSVAVPVVGDAGVHAQLQRGERAQVAGHVRRADVGPGGERLVLGRHLLQVPDLLLHGAGGGVLGAPGQAGGTAVDGAHRGGGGGSGGRGRGDRRDGGVLGGRLGERVGAL